MIQLGWFAQKSLVCRVVPTAVKPNLLIGIVISVAAWGQQYTITTVAGNGVAGFAGDNAAATSAQLNTPSGVALDAAGNLYIADAANERVRLVSKGNITTTAGDGTEGYGGDGSAATAAQLFSPARVAVDSKGNLYISDSGNDVIRMVTSGGTISTIAGIECTQDVISGCGPGYSGDGGSATAALLNDPLGIAVDAAGNLYIADSGNNVIRKVSGGTITTLRVTVRLKNPSDVAVDSNSNVFIADQGDERIVELSSTGVSSIFAGTGVDGFSGDNGPATSAQLSYLTAIAVDGAGRVYIADTFNGRIRMVANGTIKTIAGNGQTAYSGDGGPALSAAMNYPRGLAVDAVGNIYVADAGNNCIRLIAPPNPSISTNGVVNAASFAPHISPGALATVFGNYFGAVVSGAGVPLPNAIGPVSISVAGHNAPLLYVTPTQINFQIPWETVPGSANVVVSVNGNASNTVAVPVSAAGPGLFTLASGAAIVQNSDYTLNGVTNPAPAGSAIIAYLTGSGPVSTSVTDGAAAPSNPLPQMTSQVAATIGTQTASVIFAGLAPGFVGLVQVNLLVPSGLATGSYPLVITVGNEASNSGTVAVK